MHTETLRRLFAQYLKEKNLENMLVCDSCITVNQDTLLKYERVDKYKINFLDNREIKQLLRFCDQHGIVYWFGADKLCIGFNYAGCMRLSAYESVPLRQAAGEIQEDRINYVSPEISAAASLGDINRGTP